MKINNYKSYYFKILDNLKTNYKFYKNSDNEYNYLDAFNFSIKIINYLNKNKIKKGTICTYSDKSFQMEEKGGIDYFNT